MELTGLDLFLWAAALFLHIALLLVLWFRSRFGEFPAFTTLIGFSIFRSFALYITLHFGRPFTYFYMYWGMAILDIALQLGVVAEVASQVFRPLGTWTLEVRRSFYLLFAISALVASLLTWLAVPRTKALPEEIVLRGDFFTSALMGEVFIGMSALSVWMGLPWKTHVARISQGLGAYSLVGIVIEGLNNFYGLPAGNQAYTTLSHLRIFAYLSCVAYWIVMLSLKAPAPKELPESIRRQLFLLQARLTQDLQLLRSWKS